MLWLDKIAGAQKHKGRFNRETVIKTELIKTQLKGLDLVKQVVTFLEFSLVENGPIQAANDLQRILLAGKTILVFLIGFDELKHIAKKDRQESYICWATYFIFTILSLSERSPAEYWVHRPMLFKLTIQIL